MDTIDDAIQVMDEKAPDELRFCDAEVRDAFEGAVYIIGTPLMAQLIKELRLLRDALWKIENAGRWR